MKFHTGCRYRSDICILRMEIEWTACDVTVPLAYEFRQWMQSESKTCKKTKTTACTARSLRTSHHVYTGKVIAKLSHAMKIYREWRYSFTPLLLYPGGKNARYSSDRRLGGSQSLSGRCGEEKNLAHNKLLKRFCCNCNVTFIKPLKICLVNWCWSSPAQLFLVPSPAGLRIIFYCLTTIFEACDWS
jgi:hypothetical protein